MRILFADAFPAAQLDELRERGHDCVLEPGLGADDLPAAIPGFDALVVRSTKVTAATIDSSDCLALIVRAGAGTNTIDVQAAADAGVYVCNVPGQNAIAVAELTMGLLLSIDRHIPDNVADLRAGVWNKKLYSEADGVFGKRLSILGLGDIGLALAERAKAFGMTVQAQRKPGRSAATEARIRAIGIRLFDNQDELVRNADVLSVHVPAAAETNNLVDRELLALLPEGAIVLNTSRGDVVDADALIEAMDTRGIRAGLDVYPDEPAGGSGEYTSALAAHPNVTGTHHIGASTEQAQDAVATGVVDAIDSYLEGEVSNCVNMSASKLGHAQIAVRHFDRIGVLALVFGLLSELHLNVEQMENKVFAGSNAAIAIIEIAGEVPAGLTAQIESLANVIQVSITHRDDA